jgi:hypothetical protein
LEVGQSEKRFQDIEKELTETIANAKKQEYGKLMMQGTRVRKSKANLQEPYSGCESEGSGRQEFSIIGMGNRFTLLRLSLAP